MKWSSRTRDQMIEWCRANPGVTVQPINSRLTDGMRYYSKDDKMYFDTAGELSEILRFYGMDKIQWQVAEWSPVKPEIDWEKTIIECEGHGQEVAEWLNRYNPCDYANCETQFRMPKDLPAGYVDSDFQFLYERGYCRITYEEWQTYRDAATPGPEPISQKSILIDDMTRDEAHESGQFLEWVRANRDKVGLKAAWQQKEEAEQALINQVRKGE